MKKSRTSKVNMAFNGNVAYKIGLALFILSFGISGQICAQQTKPGTISVSTNATELLPANLIVFTVNINAEADSPQEAYEIHKEREEVLAGLLKKFKIEEKEISFDPVRMHKQNNPRYDDDQSKTTRTSQTVSVTFSDFSVYEKIQVELIENGFDSFNGNFSSTNIEEGKDKALVKAIQAAKEKAKIIVDAAGVTLGDISTIAYSDYQVHYPRQADMMEMKVSSGASSMMDFDQTVSVTASISIEFVID